jgi:predicted membrane protein
LKNGKIDKKRQCSILNIRTFTGVAIIFIGILFFLKNMGFLVDFKMWHHWPVLLILIGLAHIFGQKEFRRISKGILLISIGTVLMMKYHGLIHLGWKQLWPLILIITGVGIVVNSFSGGRIKTKQNSKKGRKYIDIHAVFGGGEYTINSSAFMGGRVTAIMGGVELNLKNASIKSDEVELNIFAMWGGISIRVPEDWDVSVEGTPILGGMDNQTKLVDDNIIEGTGKKRTKKLLITGVAIMGGLEVKN